MATDESEKINEVRVKHEKLLEKIKQRGYDIDNLPALTEQQRDEFETVIHNANRVRKFDWGTNEANSHSTFVNIVLCLASLIPLFIAFYFLIEVDGVSGLLVPFLLCVCLVHMYFGFVWARYVVAIGSLGPAFAQLWVFDGVPVIVKAVAYFCVVAVTINSYFLLRSRLVSQFLAFQRASLSDSRSFKLKLLRVAGVVTLIGAVTFDLIQLISL